MSMRHRKVEVPRGGRCAEESRRWDSGPTFKEGWRGKSGRVYDQILGEEEVPAVQRKEHPMESGVHGVVVITETRMTATQRSREQLWPSGLSLDSISLYIWMEQPTRTVSAWRRGVYDTNGALVRGWSCPVGLLCS